jgi:hypothetical protein
MTVVTFAQPKTNLNPRWLVVVIIFLWTPFPALLGLMAEVTTIFASMLKTQRNWYLEDHPTARFSGETTSDGKSPFSGLIPFISFIHGWNNASY